MLSRQMLDVNHKVLNLIFGYATTPSVYFGNLMVILVGDFYQVRQYVYVGVIVVLLFFGMFK